MDISQLHAFANACCSRSVYQWRCRSLNAWVSCKQSRSCFFHKNVIDPDCLPFNTFCSRNRYQIKVSLLEDGSLSSSCRSVGPQLCCLFGHKSIRMGHHFPYASADDGLTVSGSPQASTNSDIEEMRVKLDQTLQNEDCNSALVQLLHDAARVFELAIKDQSSVSKLSWFSTAWLGVDQNAWVKALSYQASVCSLLLAACDISSRGDGKDRDINIFVRRSLSRLSVPLESVIRDALSDKQPEIYEWCWSEQVPTVVSSFVNYFEEDDWFAALTGMIDKGMSPSAVEASKISLPIFALSCIAAITELGPTKVSCIQFYSVLPDITGRLMDMLVELIPINKAYHSIKEIGLCREFLVHFGSRAAACRVKDDRHTEEVLFWVNLVQKQLQRAIDRERIWSRLTTSESIEVLDKDLAIFGFFIALGRKTQRFLCAKNFEAVPEPIEGLIRYLIGGSVLYYPQLSSISSYQLYVEVVCEELDWLVFYPRDVENLKHSHGHRSKQGPPSEEAIPLALDVCSHWIQSFIEYSKWLENPSNIKAARFLSKGHNILKRSMEELDIAKCRKLMIENGATNFVEMVDSKSYAPLREELDSFDKALESVDEALLRLEELHQELHVSSSNSGNEHLKAACSYLEKIRKLKKEAEFLEASFRAKADSLQQENTRAPEANGIQRFQLLRDELIELERRVERNAKLSNNEKEEINIADHPAKYSKDAEGIQMVNVQEKENIFEKSLNKFKETTTDVLQGTQLLAIDVAAATGLLIRVLTGDELMEKEKQALRRTLTDLASVVPIGFLMLLPVTAVGHAAMLAAIQRYIPSLIPSTYGPERLDLMRQLKKVKEMDTTDVNLTACADES